MDTSYTHTQTLYMNSVIDAVPKPIPIWLWPLIRGVSGRDGMVGEKGEKGWPGLRGDTGRGGEPGLGKGEKGDRGMQGQPGFPVSVQHYVFSRTLFYHNILVTEPRISVSQIVCFSPIITYLVQQKGEPVDETKYYLY